MAPWKKRAKHRITEVQCV
uniref:Uncharacterized protein n=1 Tax=Anopheles quadriannulatus TaxID=34691 RepID=A0A182XQJ3_ANOQN